MFDLSALWLKVTYVTLTNRDNLKKWWVILLIALDVFMVVFVVTNGVLYLVGIPKQRQLLLSIAASAVDYPAIRQRSKPLPLEIVTTAAIPVSKGKYDLVTQVKNPNTQWFASRVNYTYTLDGKDGDVLTEFVQPTVDTYLAVLGTSYSGTAAPAVAVKLNSVEWQRIDHPDRLAAIRFEVSQTATATITDPKTNAAAYRVTATVTNRSYQSFWQTRFAVALYSGDRLVGLAFVYPTPAKFGAGEERSIQAQWPPLPVSVTSVSIVPAFNLLDPAN
ncbi:MAG: hypothetical protein V1916_02790, partial [Patescibacteria group bacterium]